MLRSKALLFATLFVLSACAEESAAQIGFSVTQQNGVISGGGMTVGGVVSGDRRMVNLGLSASANNLVVQDAITRGALNAAIAARRDRLPDVDQFVRNVKQFDRDQNELLDKDELRQVGLAVIKELQQMRGRNSPEVANAYANGDVSGNKQPTTGQLAEIFVQRCMAYDANRDQALNATETKRMAAALIRSLI
ncbi:MAG: hypothetical protein R3C19_04925 [Planctomycetaceae bacterium]